MTFPEIRCDDVLQNSGITKHQQAVIEDHSLFMLFLEVDKYFLEANYPCILAVCADGIDKYSGWVEYIKKNIYRYKIELHCNHHQNYKFLPRAEIVSELRTAIQKIENTFETKITTWYPPKGRKGEPEDKDGICEELGIKCYQQIGKVDAKLWHKNPEGYPHINFHFWHPGQVNQVIKIIKLWQAKQGKH